MTENSKKPEPIDSGSSGTQIESDKAVTGDLVESETKSIFPDTIKSLSGINSRYLGSEPTSTLLEGWARQITNDNADLRNQLRWTQTQIDSLKTNLSDSRVENAVLAGANTALKQSRNLRNGIIAIGSILLPVSVDFFLGGNEKQGAIVGIVALFLITIGWLHLGKGNK